MLEKSMGEVWSFCYRCHNWQSPWGFRAALFWFEKVFIIGPLWDKDFFSLHSMSWWWITMFPEKTAPKVMALAPKRWGWIWWIHWPIHDRRVGKPFSQTLQLRCWKWVSRPITKKAGSRQNGVLQKWAAADAKILIFFLLFLVYWLQIWLVLMFINRSGM